MKKLIVASIILVASVCWADMGEIFDKLNVIKENGLVTNDPTFFGTTKESMGEFKMSVDELFRNNDNYWPITPWTKVNDRSYCVGFTDLKELYAMCVDGNVVVLREVK